MTTSSSSSSSPSSSSSLMVVVRRNTTTSIDQVTSPSQGHGWVLRTQEEELGHGRKPLSRSDTFSLSGSSESSLSKQGGTQLLRRRNEKHSTPIPSDTIITPPSLISSTSIHRSLPIEKKVKPVGSFRVSCVTKARCPSCRLKKSLCVCLLIFIASERAARVPRTSFVVFFFYFKTIASGTPPCNVDDLGKPGIITNTGVSFSSPCRGM